MRSVEDYLFHLTSVETLSNQVLNHYTVSHEGREICIVVEHSRNAKIISALASGKDIESVGRNKEEALKKFLSGIQANVIEQEIAPGITERTILNNDQANSTKNAIYCFISVVGLMLLFTGQVSLLVILVFITWLFVVSNP
ncbi:hypothetical protein [Aliterella atlantica]|uniref:Uncharacterized protein n=1 Tax=Aliterella atlantica CENA595 TaxID=1618023 RepID=A0A0D8ZSN9_9CYAN|nr:hypothetical protein [Aliterella atlantica]KJH70231.1 hypothetical protein UH38_18920 [Aliterella atlantica CENA595]